MKPEIEFKLLRIISNFKGMILKGFAFKEKEVGNRKLIVLEMTFSSNGQNQTMVLVLDKDITLGDYEDIYEKVIR